MEGPTIHADHPGNQDVLALAPSQIAATVLADSIGARAENIAKWLHEHRNQTKRATDAATRNKSYRPDPAWTLQPGQLVIVDEASMVTTREIDAILTAVRTAGAKLLLVGDNKQLGAIGAGGMFATIVDRTTAPVLTTVRRSATTAGSCATGNASPPSACATATSTRSPNTNAAAASTPGRSRACKKPATGPG